MSPLYTWPWLCVAGTVFEGDKRFDIQVRLPDEVRNDMESNRTPTLSRFPRGTDGRLGLFRFRPWLVLISHQALTNGGAEDGKRRIVVSANVRGRDIGSFVTEAQQRLESLQLPAGYWTRWGGTFENSGVG